MGSNNGIDVINNQQHSIRHLGTTLGIEQSRQQLIRLMKDKQGQIWISVAPLNGSGSKMMVIDLVNRKLRILAGNGRLFGNPQTLISDSKGRIWISDYGSGVILFDSHNNSAKHINTTNGLAGNIVWKILEAKDGKIWVATSKGLSIISEDASHILSLHKKDGLSDNVTQSLVQDADGAMWVSTNEGIDRIDLKKNTITAFTKQQGLSENESFALETIAGKIYAGTSSGINIIEHSSLENNTWQVSSFAREQGFYYLDVNSNTSLATKDNKLYWGIQQVVTAMDVPPGDSTVNPVYISGVIIGDISPYYFKSADMFAGRSTTDTVWTEKKDTFFLKDRTQTIKSGNAVQWDSVSGLFRLPVGLSMSHQQNQIKFHFTSIPAAEGAATRYSYMLEGLDDDWSEPSSSAQSPDYNNLSPGNYTFLVSSKGANGRWSEPASFSFSISPPWWKTWWAYVIYSLVFVLGLRAYTAYRSSVLRKENSVLESKVNDRTAALNKSLDDLKATQSQLIQSEKMASLGELTAGIAHEIQNPLNFVNNFAEVNNELIDELRVEMDKGNVEDVKALATDIQANEQKILQHGRRADGIVKGMLQHSRSSGNVKEATDINKLLDEYLLLAYHGIRARDNAFNAKLMTDYDGAAGIINIIPQDIGRVILNLINNAFYAVQEKKKLTADFIPCVYVGTKKSGNTLNLQIADNGNGIDQTIINKVFQPFFTTKPTGEGTGLGLSLAYDIVKAHGGQLTVANQPSDPKGLTGAWFTITLPTS